MSTGPEKVIEFTIVDGKISFDAKNFHGVGCEDSVRFLLELDDQAELSHKPEYNAGQTNRQYTLR